MNAQFLSVKSLTDSIWPLRTCPNISSAEVSGGMFPKYTVLLLELTIPDAICTGPPKFGLPILKEDEGDWGPARYCGTP